MDNPARRFTRDEDWPKHTLHDEIDRLRFELAAARNGYDARGAEIASLHTLIHALRQAIAPLLADPGVYKQGDRGCVFCGLDALDSGRPHDDGCPILDKDYLLGP